MVDLAFPARPLRRLMAAWAIVAVLQIQSPDKINGRRQDLSSKIGSHQELLNSFVSLSHPNANG